MWNGQIIIVKEGQLITGRDQLSDATGIHRSSVERILDFLENEHQIEQQKTTKYRLITILNWDGYQKPSITSSNKRATSEQQASTNNNDKKEKNDNNTTEQSSGATTNAFISLFKEINPSYSILFRRQPQRDAADRLLKLHDFAWWQRFMEAYQLALDDRYCPRATTPSKLEEKLGDIESYGKRRKAEKTKIANDFII
jgi:hypothetical protein